MARRGDVVIVDFPFTDVPGAKRRPAVVIQDDRQNGMIARTIVAMVTGNLRRRTWAIRQYLKKFADRLGNSCLLLALHDG